jgi:2-amino-4-hydroxy-6-hydroxymethyldihydropteridine diphosphokinase
VYIGLGANLGDRRSQLESAIDSLASLPETEVVKVSGFYETDPVGGPARQPMYLNAAAELKTRLSARALLEALHGIEARAGRERAEHWGPRVLDLDILLFGDEVVAEEDLEIPHPRMHERLFVLDPLCEIAPDVRHPTLRCTVQTLLESLRGRHE